MLCKVFLSLGCLSVPFFDASYAAHGHAGPLVWSMPPMPLFLETPPSTLPASLTSPQADVFSYGSLLYEISHRSCSLLTPNQGGRHTRV